MTDTPSFAEQRVAVLQSQLQLALVEVAELEAIIAKAEEQLTDAQRHGLKPHAAAGIRHTLTDTNGATLKRRDAETRSKALEDAAVLVVQIVDDALVRADHDCADAARNAFDRALAEAHSKLLVASKVAAPDA